MNDPQAGATYPGSRLVDADLRRVTEALDRDRAPAEQAEIDELLVTIQERRKAYRLALEDIRSHAAIRFGMPRSALAKVVSFCQRRAVAVLDEGG